MLDCAATQYDLLELPKECTVAEMIEVLSKVKPSAIICLGSLLSPIELIDPNKMRIPIIVSRGRFHISEEVKLNA